MLLMARLMSANVRRAIGKIVMVTPPKASRSTRTRDFTGWVE